MAIDRSPARLSAALAVAFAGFAVIAAGPEGALLGGIGVPLVLAGVVFGWRRAVTIGAFVVFAGVVLAGVREAPPEGLLVGTAAVVLAWDLGENAIGLGEQLGRAARTRRAEITHAALATLVGVVAVALGYAVFRLATGGQPLAALVFLLAAAIALLEALRD